MYIIHSRHLFHSDPSARRPPIALTLQDEIPKWRTVPVHTGLEDNPLPSNYVLCFLIARVSSVCQMDYWIIEEGINNIKSIAK